jgi:hypothetical protein
MGAILTLTNKEILYSVINEGRNWNRVWPSRILYWGAIMELLKGILFFHV